MKGKIALVTGVSSGIGREIARFLADRGARVYGTVRGVRPADAAAGIELVRMDVTSDSEVAEAVQFVLHQAGRIDILVNNAGYVLAGALEETSIDEARRQFETNFFGVLRVTRAVLPSMRRHGYGRIVNISSILGLLPGPYRGIYAASKHALEGYTETLDHEVRRFGVRAVLIEPGYTRTGIETNGKLVSAGLEVYAEPRRRVQELVRRKTDEAGSPRAVAEAVYRAVTARSPRLRYPVGQAVFLSRLRRFLPAAFFDMGFRKQFRLDETERDQAAELAKGGI